MSAVAEPLPAENVKPITLKPARRRMAPAASATFNMEQQLAAAAALKEQLRAIFGDDDDAELLRDTIEGETSLLESMDRVLEQMTLDRELIAGIDAMTAKREERKRRLTERADAMEAMLLGVLTILEAQRIERPLALMFTRKLPDKAVITDEALIPAAYFKQPDPTLSKSDLLRALKDHHATLAGKLAEIAERVKAGEMLEPDADQAAERVRAAFPSIPGAELEPGGTGITVKWS